MDLKPACAGCAILGMRAQLHAHPTAPGWDKDVALAGCHPVLGDTGRRERRQGRDWDRSCWVHRPPTPCSPSSQGCFSATFQTLDNLPFFMSLFWEIHHFIARTYFDFVLPRPSEATPSCAIKHPEESGDHSQRYSHLTF